MFRTNQPVTSSAFFDRDAELERLTQTTDCLVRGAPRWLAILGTRKIGKTSLLLELSRRNRAQSVRHVHIDVLEAAPVSREFFRRYALRVLDAAWSTELGQSLEALALSPRDYAAAVAAGPAFAALDAGLRRFLLDLPTVPVDAPVARQCLMLADQLASDRRRFFIAIDEFQDLAVLQRQRPGIDAFAIMRSVWQKHHRAAYVISGSGRSMLRNLVASRESPFFQHFDLLELGPLPREQAVRLLVEASPKQQKIPVRMARRVVEVLGSHPFYVQLVGEAITRLQPPYDEAALKSGLQDVLFSSTGRLALFFESEWRRLVGTSTFLARVLNALADGPKRLTDIASEVSAQPGHVSGYIGRLGDAVRRLEDGRYDIDDATFALWLRWRRPGGSVMPMTLVGSAAELEVARDLARLGFELVYQSRASRGAFDLVATRGAHQVGIQVKRTDLPVRFTKAEWARMVADAKRFGWLWLIAVVDTEGNIWYLDPAEAAKRREVRLGADAHLDNVLAWVDRG